MRQNIIEDLKLKLIKLAQHIAANSSNELEVFIYQDKNLEKIFEDYEYIKNSIKNFISDKNFLVDRHKIAAIFLYSIIQNKPILIKENKTDIEDKELEFIINMNLAMAFGAYIIQSFYKSSTNKEIKLVVPDSNTTNYLDQLFSLIKILTEKITNEDKLYLLLTISHIFYLIEKFSECKNKGTK